MGQEVPRPMWEIGISATHTRMYLATRASFRCLLLSVVTLSSRCSSRAPRGTDNLLIYPSSVSGRHATHHARHASASESALLHSSAAGVASTPFATSGDSNMAVQAARVQKPMGRQARWPRAIPPQHPKRVRCSHLERDQFRSPDG